jgi:hypothetical protein
LPSIETVTKESFLTLTRNFASFSAEEAKELIVLQNKYPFSQAIRSLVARATQDNALDPQQQHLHTCAVYSTDRAILKWVMTVPREVKSEILPRVEISTAPIATIPIEKKELPGVSKPEVVQEIQQPVQNIDLHGDDLIDQVVNDLKTLKKLKHSFEVSHEKFEKNREHLESIPATDILIEEIKHTRKKIKTEDIKQKEQIEIIDQFIKIQPSIKAKTKPVVEEIDLSEKSFEHTDKFVSETLVEIFIKQGKTEKAIEVLKKLIWKFPQKKAYFATRIEDLRK